MSERLGDENWRPNSRFTRVYEFVKRSSPTVVLLCLIIAVADVLLFINYFQDVEDPEPPLPHSDFSRLVHGLQAVKEKPTFKKRAGNESAKLLNTMEGVGPVHTT
jgi:hypothetical protein